MDVIKTYIPKRYRNKKLVNTGGGNGSATVVNSGSSDISPSAFVDSDTFYSMFEYDAVNDAIRAKKEFYSIAGITAYGTGTVGGGSGGGGATVYNGLDSTDISLALSAAMGKQLNDTKLNSSAVSAWALASVKPVYAISEITGLSTAIAGKADATHQHTISQITDFAHVHQWTEIENKPTSFEPSAHVHSWNSVTGKPTTFAPSAHDHTFASLTSKPTKLSGYGITDAVTINTSQDITATKGFIKQSSQTSPVLQPLFIEGTGGDTLNLSASIGFHNPNHNWGSIVLHDDKFKFMNNDMSNYKDISALNGIFATDIITNFKAWTKDSSKSLKSFLDKFDIDANGNLVVIGNLYSTGEVTAYSSGTGISGLTLMGDMNANGKNINNLTSISKSGSKIRLLDGSIAFDVVGYDNQLIIGDDGIFTTTYIEADAFFASDSVNAPEFKFGNWSFKEVSGNMVIYYNGTAKATIQSTRTNSNL